LKNIYAVIWPGVLIVCLVLFSQPGIIVSYFVKDPAAAAESASLLKTLSFLLLIISLNMPFYQTLLAYHKDWLTVRVLMGCSLISVLLNLVLVPILAIKGTIISLYVVESLVTSLLIYLTLQFKKKTVYAQRTLFK
jgi:O-antigen/teichoic acid export membrane protein